MPLTFTQQDVTFALAVEYLQVSALNPSRAFRREDLFSRNNARGE